MHQWSHPVQSSKSLAKLWGRRTLQRIGPHHKIPQWSRTHHQNVTHIDREFKPFMDAVEDEMDVTMNCANKGEHVPKAERNNQTLKDRIWMKCHRLPHKNAPKVMMKESVFDVAEKMNCFPTKDGMSKCHSPRMTMKQRSLDHKKDCQCEFGEHVQAHKEPKTSKKNTPTERTIDTIHPQPDKNW